MAPMFQPSDTKNPNHRFHQLHFQITLTFLLELTYFNKRIQLGSNHSRRHPHLNKEHSASLNIKLKIIETIRENVQEIRNRASLVRSEQSEGEREYIRIGNSHKVLRYLVEKVRGTE